MSSSNEEEDAAPSGVPYDDKRQADLHWRQIEQLKGAAVCIRLYRNRLARQVKAVDSIKAVASSGAIAAWFAFDAYKLLWGCIIAAAQLLDVLKDVFPFAKLHRQAASLTVALELLLIDAEDGSSSWKLSRNISPRGSSQTARLWPWQPRRPGPIFLSPTTLR